MRIRLLLLVICENFSSLFGSITCNKTVRLLFLIVGVRWYLNFQTLTKDDNTAWCIPEDYEITKPPFLCKYNNIIHNIPLNSHIFWFWKNSVLSFRRICLITDFGINVSQGEWEQTHEPPLHLLCSRDQWDSGWWTETQDSNVSLRWVGGSTKRDFTSPKFFLFLFDYFCFGSS